MPGELRWQWTLSNRADVTAIIDEARNVEAVLQGTKVLSECPRGGLPDGHVVTVEAPHDPTRSQRPPVEAVVTFSPASPIAILRVEGQEVAPRVWPTRKRKGADLPPPKPPAPLGRYIAIGAAIIALVAVGTIIRALRGDESSSSSSRSTSGKPDEIHRAMNGLFVAHYPKGFDAKMPVLGLRLGGVMLTEKDTRATTIAIAALTLDQDVRERWDIQKVALPEVLANLPKGAGRYEEASRGEETCVGIRGATVTGQIMEKGTKTARVWSCAFVHENAGYFVLMMLLEPVTASDERAARAIIEATELTRLSDMGGLHTVPSGEIDPTGGVPELQGR